jgi:hypothetical protein
MNVNARIEPEKKPISLSHGRSGRNRFKIKLKKTQVRANMILATRIVKQSPKNNRSIFLTLSFM